VCVQLAPAGGRGAALAVEQPVLPVVSVHAHAPHAPLARARQLPSQHW